MSTDSVNTVWRTTALKLFKHTAPERFCQLKLEYCDTQLSDVSKGVLCMLAGIAVCFYKTVVSPRTCPYMHESVCGKET
jgi:hypothetical protein